MHIVIHKPALARVNQAIMESIVNLNVFLVDLVINVYQAALVLIVVFAITSLENVIVLKVGKVIHAAKCVAKEDMDLIVQKSVTAVMVVSATIYLVLATVSSQDGRVKDAVKYVTNGNMD